MTKKVIITVKHCHLSLDEQQAQLGLSQLFAFFLPDVHVILAASLSSVGYLF